MMKRGGSRRAPGSISRHHDRLNRAEELTKMHERSRQFCGREELEALLKEVLSQPPELIEQARKVLGN
jgi:hypothetical protein